MKHQINPRSAIVLILIFVIFLLGIFSFSKSKDYEKLQAIFQQEQQDLKKDLDEMIKDYSDVVVRKKRLSKRLKVELVKMRILRDSIENLKLDNYNLIRKYRRKIATLERENRNLFIRIDSLNEANLMLAQENTIAKELIEQKDKSNTTLTSVNRKLQKNNKNLEEKVAVAGAIKTGDIRAIAMKERSSGKLTSTSRSSRTDAFKINLDLLENEVTTPGERNVYIQIANEAKEVVGAKGKTKLDNGQRVAYTDSIQVNYNNQRMSLVSFILVDREEIKEGRYTISAFVDGKYTGNAVVKLR